MLRRTILVQGLYGFTLSSSYMSALFYLPLYFQSIQGVDALESGVRNLPTVLTVTVFIIASGGFITKTGHAVPVQALGSALCSVGVGLYYTMDTSTSTGRWVGYQIISSVGWGIGYQVPNMIAGGSTPPSDLATATAIILCKQQQQHPFLCSSPPRSSFSSPLSHSIPQLFIYLYTHHTPHINTHTHT